MKKKYINLSKCIFLITNVSMLIIILVFFFVRIRTLDLNSFNPLTQLDRDTYPSYFEYNYV